LLWRKKQTFRSLSQRLKDTHGTFYPAALAWLMVLLSVLIIITYVPAVSLIVPSLLGIL
jgi:TRAP-type C4-dicarboxylate transport system permease large subunit